MQPCRRCAGCKPVACSPWMYALVGVRRPKRLMVTGSPCTNLIATPGFVGAQLDWRLQRQLEYMCVPLKSAMLVLTHLEAL